MIRQSLSNVVHFVIRSDCQGGSLFLSQTKEYPVLTKHNSVGYAVLAELCNQMTDDEWQLASVEPYLNGRENGFSVVLCIPDGKLIKCVFSGARRSDDIVVYAAPEMDFGMNNELTDAIYFNLSRPFSAGKYSDAAEYILVQLRATK